MKFISQFYVFLFTFFSIAISLIYIKFLTFISIFPIESFGADFASQELTPGSNLTLQFMVITPKVSGYPSTSNVDVR